MMDRNLRELYYKALANGATPPHLRRQIIFNLWLSRLVWGSFYAGLVLGLGALFFSFFRLLGW